MVGVMIFLLRDTHSVETILQNLNFDLFQVSDRSTMLPHDAGQLQSAMQSRE